MDDVAESALDAVNSIEPTIAMVLIFIIWLRVIVVANEEKDYESSE